MQPLIPRSDRDKIRHAQLNEIMMRTKINCVHLRKPKDQLKYESVCFQTIGGKIKTLNLSTKLRAFRKYLVLTGFKGHFQKSILSLIFL